MKYLLIFLITFNVLASGDITSPELYKLINKENFDGIVIDVRTPSEWKDTGTIKGALKINAYNPNFVNEISKLDKN